MRTGNTFNYYLSNNGTTFQFSGAVTVSLPSCVLIGIYTESISPGITTTAVFSNISFSGAVTLPTPSDPGGIDRIAASAFDFQVFPNPSGGEVNLAFSGQIGQLVTVRVYNVFGESLLSKEVEVWDDQAHPLDLLEFASGVYFVQVQIPGSLPVTKRIVLER